MSTYTYDQLLEDWNKAKSVLQRIFQIIVFLVCSCFLVDTKMEMLKIYFLLDNTSIILVFALISFNMFNRASHNNLRNHKCQTLLMH